LFLKEYSPSSNPSALVSFTSVPVSSDPGSASCILYSKPRSTKVPKIPEISPVNTVLANTLLFFAPILVTVGGGGVRVVNSTQVPHCLPQLSSANAL
jgi:hypothetical protein